MAQVYGFLSIALWWLLVTTTLFWKVWFPLDAKTREAKKQIKYIHLGFGLVGLLVPIIPVITVIARFAKENPGTDLVSGGLGFNIPRFPPLPCNAGDVDIIFYTSVLPSIVILAIGLTLILLIFWLLHRVSSKLYFRGAMYITLKIASLC